MYINLVDWRLGDAMGHISIKAVILDLVHQPKPGDVNTVAIVYSFNLFLNFAVDMVLGAFQWVCRSVRWKGDGFGGTEPKVVKLLTSFLRRYC